jgi:type VI protein secretion system component Hcp
MALYMKLGSGKDQMFGESRDKHHVGWVKISGFSWSSGKQVRSASGGGSDKLDKLMYVLL